MRDDLKKKNNKQINMNKNVIIQQNTKTIKKYRKKELIIYNSF